MREQLNTDLPTDGRLVTSEVGVIEGNIGQISASSGSYDININKLNSGYLVKVGCQRIAVETTEKLIKNLESYLKNPEEYQKAWYDTNEINKLK